MANRSTTYVNSIRKSSASSTVGGVVSPNKQVEPSVHEDMDMVVKVSEEVKSQVDALFGRLFSEENSELQSVPVNRGLNAKVARVKDTLVETNGKLTAILNRLGE